jgi:hypothetical protein
VGRPKTRWEEDNNVSVNWAAVAATAALVGALVGLAVLLALT